MSPRIVTARPGLWITWGDDARGTVIQGGITQAGNRVWLQGGQMIDVQPGSALEAQIGAANLRTPTAGELASASVGTGRGAISN